MSYQQISYLRAPNKYWKGRSRRLPHHSDHIVIGSVRDAKASQAEDLKKLPTGDSSWLLLVSIESSSHSHPEKAIQDIEAAGIDHADIVISSADISPGPAPLDLIDSEVVLEIFNINTVSSIVLFQQ